MTNRDESCPFYREASAVCAASLRSLIPPRAVRTACCTAGGGHEDCATFLARLLMPPPPRRRTA